MVPTRLAVVSFALLATVGCGRFREAEVSLPADGAPACEEVARVVLAVQSMYVRQGFIPTGDHQEGATRVLSWQRPTKPEEALVVRVAALPGVVRVLVDDPRREDPRRGKDIERDFESRLDALRLLGGERCQ